MRASRDPKRALGALCAWAFASTLPWAVHAEALACDPWPGEPAPLPRADDTDPLRARWAALRADELAQLARPVEAISSSDAHRLWRHVDCLDPGRAGVREALERTAVARVHQPTVQIEARAPREAERRGDLRAALDTLGDPIRVGAAAEVPTFVRSGGTEAPATRPEPAPDFEAADTLLGQAEALLREARFEDALARAEQARRKLPGGAAAGGRRARIESVAATAQVALGRDAEARQSFGAALEADPQFRLDAQRTSPKVMRAFDAARSAQGAPAGGAARPTSGGTDAP